MQCRSYRKKATHQAQKRVFSTETTKTEKKMSHKVEKEAKRLPLRIAYQFLQPKFQNIFLKIQQIVPAKTQKKRKFKREGKTVTQPSSD